MERKTFKEIAKHIRKYKAYPCEVKGCYVDSFTITNLDFKSIGKELEICGRFCVHHCCIVHLCENPAVMFDHCVVHLRDC